MSKQAKVLTEHEFRKLLKVCELTRYKERNRMIVMLSFMLGLRAVEIAKLCVSNVVSENGEILDLLVLDKTQTKGNKRNSVPISDKAKAELKRYFIKYPHLLNALSSRLIISQKGVFSSQTVQHLFKHLYELASIKQASSHSGRRSFITQLSDNGIAVAVIQKLARHSSLAVTQRYIEVSDAKLKNAVNTVVAFGA
jgi:integrase/recombinase XerD